MRVFTAPQRQIIELLLNNDKTLPELASALGKSKPGTSKDLKGLEELHIVKGAYETNINGRTIRYRLQPYHMVLSIDPSSKTVFSFFADDAFDEFFPFLGFIPQKEFRSEVKVYLQEMQKTDIRRFILILYGSVAQGTATRKSDIDFLLVKDEWEKSEQSAILRLLAEASEKTTHLAKPLFLGVSAFENLDSSLKKEINDHGVILLEKGSPWEMIRKDFQRYKTIIG